jgi:membrane protein YdbS with pleckstrin-like domain
MDYGKWILSIGIVVFFILYTAFTIYLISYYDNPTPNLYHTLISAGLMAIIVVMFLCYFIPHILRIMFK